jgi:hypothetical protein
MGGGHRRIELAAPHQRCGTRSRTAMGARRLAIVLLVTRRKVSVLDDERRRHRRAATHSPRACTQSTPFHPGTAAGSRDRTAGSSSSSMRGIGARRPSVFRSRPRARRRTCGTGRQMRRRSPREIRSDSCAYSSSRPRHGKQSGPAGLRGGSPTAAAWSRKIAGA